MKFLKITFGFLFLFFFLGSPVPRTNLSCREIITTMLDTIKNIRTQEFELKSTERINKGLNFASSKVRLNNIPRKIYFKSIHKGAELIWIEGTNKGNAIVHTPTVPFMNLDLDPLGNMLRKDQHHTIFELGFQHIAITIANTIVKHPKEFDKHFLYAGTITINGYECFQIIIDYPEYKYIEYTTGKNETVSAISHKLNTSDFKIRSINNLHSYYGSIKEGKKLTIPIPYANKAIMCIDKKLWVPVSLKIYDEDGLFEAYEYTNINVNKHFANDVFSIKNKEYDFKN